MSKVFTSKKFIEKLQHVVSLPTTYYSVSGGQWAKWNGSSWNFDCVILVKALLWGWCENKNAAHGGANYLSNGVLDDNADGIINRCSDISSDFNNITPGELLWMNGHVGVYVGNRQVIECTGAWEHKVVYSYIGYNGERIRNNIRVGSWKKHGKLPYIDYTDAAPQPSTSKTKTVEELAREVIKGAWGNQDDNPSRQQKLESAGYNFRRVQDRVNEILGIKKQASSTKKLYLPAKANSWRVYPLDKAPYVGNECGFLRPSKFGGLTYDIIRYVNDSVVVIETRDFGTVQIYVAPDTGAIIK